MRSWQCQMCCAVWPKNVQSEFKILWCTAVWYGSRVDVWCEVVCRCLVWGCIAWCAPDLVLSIPAFVRS